MPILNTIKITSGYFELQEYSLDISQEEIDVSYESEWDCYESEETGILPTPKKWRDFKWLLSLYLVDEGHGYGTGCFKNSVGEKISIKDIYIELFGVDSLNQEVATLQKKEKPPLEYSEGAIEGILDIFIQEKREHYSYSIDLKSEEPILSELTNKTFTLSLPLSECKLKSEQINQNIAAGVENKKKELQQQLKYKSSAYSSNRPDLYCLGTEFVTGQHIFVDLCRFTQLSNLDNLEPFLANVKINKNGLQYINYSFYSQGVGFKCL